ncbi:MAG: hypothetical protein EOP09_14850, partial [Proteobacteria bacterium]
MKVSNQLFLTSNKNMVIEDSEFSQTSSRGQPNIFLVSHSSGLIFRNNIIASKDGSAEFAHVSDSVIENNHFIRDVADQAHQEAIAHRLVIAFAHRTSIFNNRFDVVNGPVTATNRNDGETILAEASAGNNTENLGTATGATATTLTDSGNTINVLPFSATEIVENYGVSIVEGKGMGQSRRVIQYSGKTLTIDRAWDVVPDATSKYVTFVWGLERVLIKGNQLFNNPRGIWLYQTALRDVEVIGNSMMNGGGIYLRSWLKAADKQFDIIRNVRISGNSVTNNDGLWASHVSVHFITADTQFFGTAILGVEVRDNTLQANRPNVSLNSNEEYAGTEGFLNMMRIERNGGVMSSFPLVLGSIFQSNQCADCEHAFKLGTGADGTSLIDNSPHSSASNFLQDSETLYGSSGGATRTVVE